VETAEHSPVLLRGQTTFNPGDDVVNLTVDFGFLAIRMSAFPIPQLNASPGGASEESGSRTDIDPVAQPEDRTLDIGMLEPRNQRTR